MTRRDSRPDAGLDHRRLDGSKHDGGSEDPSEALRLALRIAVPVEDPEHVEERRRGLVDLIERELTDVPLRRQKRRRRTFALRALAAAALLGAVGSASVAGYQAYSRGGGPEASADNRGAAPERSPGSPDEGLAAVVRHRPSGSEHVLAEASTTLRATNDETLSAKLPGGTWLQLDPGGRLTLAGLDERAQDLVLDAGHLHVDVPESATPTTRRRLRVRTPHAVVEVKGTRFEVRLVPRGQGLEATFGAVERGVVLVSDGGAVHELHAGQSWESAPGRRAASMDSTKNDFLAPARAGGHASAPGETGSSAGPGSVPNEGSTVGSNAVGTLEQPAGADGASPATGASHATNPASSAPAESTLSEQNRLLERAILAERRGDRDLARQLLDELVVRYPDSPLRATVLGERRRLDSAER